MSYKRNQIEEAIARISVSNYQKPPSELRTRIKRLLELDRSMGRKLRSLTPLTNAIMAYNGTIDKYIGDAIMAFWNAPLDDPVQETDACNAALDMLERVNALNQEREREASSRGIHFAPIRIGIGINT
jgi:class 3 adenylate cyclase